MKKSIFSLFVVLGLSFCLYSCEKQDGGDTDGDTPKEEYIELGLMPKGIDFSITPMSNRASSSDMYSVVVLRGEDQPYATWTTNDLTSEKFKLIKGDTKGIRECLAKFDIPAAEAAIVGDQIYTDTLGGNLSGITPILVNAIDNHNFWLKARHVLEMPFIYAARKRRINHEES